MMPRKVLLIGWDAADWKIIQPLADAGKMPNLLRLVENGASGHIATLHPPLSPMLWTSIATGKRPFKHGILGFSEPTPDGRDVQPVSNLSRKSKPLWNILNQNAFRSVVIGWWPSHPAEPIDGVMVSDHYHRANRPLDEGWLPVPNAVHPPELAQTLADLRVHPDQLAPEMIQPFIPLASQIDQDKDHRLGLCMRTLAECMSIQAAAMWLIENQPWDLFAVYYDSIDHFCHGFMKYHPPRLSWISKRDFEVYQNVVAMAYQCQDRMLGELLDKAGPDTTVVLLSDHGFHPDHLRPASIPEIPAGPAIEHRDLGVLVVSGPGIRRGEKLHGASLLDVAPTILTLYGLPVSEDMDGKVLSQAFAETPEIAPIPSWEAVRGADGCHPPHTRLDPVAAQLALDQMIVLGYVEPPDENRKTAVETTIRELRYNLGEAYQDDDRHIEAREIFAELCAADPDEHRFAVRLFASCQALGLRKEMRRIVEDLDCRRRTLARFRPAVVDYLKARLFIEEKRYAEALAVLERLPSAHMVRPGVLLETAELYLHLGRSHEARQVYKKALAIDPDNAPAHAGLSRLALRQKKFNLAVDSALDALERMPRYPLAHFLLGRALAGMKEYEQAADALRAALSFNPHFPEAHTRLAALLEKHLGNVESAREHRRLARLMQGRKKARPQPKTLASATVASACPKTPSSAITQDMPPLDQSLTVVTGLPRSGTSMLMQMLAAGGMNLLTDGLRPTDEDNPRGYFEFEPVKRMLRDSTWLSHARGKAVKIVAPLLDQLPPGLPCRVILCERNLDEILDSQERMLARRNQPPSTRGRRQILKDEYLRMLERTKSLLVARPATRLLVVKHRHAVSDSLATAEQVNTFLGGTLNRAKMAAAVDPALHRNRAVTQNS